MFRISVNEKQLRLKKKLEVLLGLELAVLKSNTNARWAVRIEWAAITEDATPTGAAITVTADAGANTLTAAAHGLAEGTPVKVASSGTVPGGLTAGTVYYVKNTDTNTLQLSAALGGAVLDLTSAGTGTITVTAQPGRNLKEVVWNPVPLLEQVLEVTPVPLCTRWGAGSRGRWCQRWIRSRPPASCTDLRRGVRRPRPAQTSCCGGVWCASTRKTTKVIRVGSWPSWGWIARWA
ncbi:hypothetical protein [Verrucomicrobium spinosum]|uniref:hypothetical protein n=1 Tax=Verrucomicrobium spinosum TaxID=2736 RepID=UPI00094684D0|nr:hypothetical protein [Verrucomicrobium spinosum]